MRKYDVPWRGLALAGCLGCFHAFPVQTFPKQETVQRASKELQTFVDAIENKDFSRAYLMLSERWRVRYSPERFRQDFELEPAAVARLERVRQALIVSAPRVDDREVVFPIGETKGVHLIREGEAYKVDSLE